MNQKTRIALEIFVLIVILALCILIYNQDKNTSCSKCVIKFKQLRSNGFELKEPKVLEVHPDSLFEWLSNKSCNLKWDQVNGYYKN